MKWNQKKEKSFSPLDGKKKKKERKKVPEGLAEKERKGLDKKAWKSFSRASAIVQPPRLGHSASREPFLSCPRRGIESRKEERDPAGRRRDREKEREGERGRKAWNSGGILATEVEDPS